MSSKANVLVELRSAKVPGLAGYFADHHWLLVLSGVVGNQYETCDRWEVWQHPNQNENCWGYLHKNLLGPCSGVGNGPSRSIKRWQEDEAIVLVERIESAPEQYPYRDSYACWPGPNSNTFAQWVVQPKMKLGIRAIGRSYPLSKRTR